MNYFNYFTEIEEHFQRRRGGALLLSTLDWALIETWKDARLPLQAVLRGIDAVFDRQDRRPGRTRKVNGLAFCTQEVLLAAEQMKEAAIGAGATPSAAPPAIGFGSQEVASFLRRSAAALQAAQLPELAAPVAEEAIATLLRVAEETSGRESVALEDLERLLTAFEEKLLAALLTATPSTELAAIQAEVDREIVAYRRKMQAAQIHQLHRQYVQKRLFDKAKVPRLSLFYM